MSSVSKKLLDPLRLHHIHWQALAAHTRNVTLRHIIDPVSADPEHRVLVGSGINFQNPTIFDSLNYVIQYLSVL